MSICQLVLTGLHRFNLFWQIAGLQIRCHLTNDRSDRRIPSNLENLVNLEICETWETLLRNFVTSRDYVRRTRLLFLCLWFVLKYRLHLPQLRTAATLMWLGLARYQRVDYWTLKGIRLLTLPSASAQYDCIIETESLCFLLQTLSQAARVNSQHLLYVVTGGWSARPPASSPYTS